jgi:hypothetical protein
MEQNAEEYRMESRMESRMGAERRAEWRAEWSRMEQNVVESALLPWPPRLPVTMHCNITLGARNIRLRFGHDLAQTHSQRSR